MSRRKAFLLRVTPGLHRAIERWSQDELRSVNAQIEYLLTLAVRQAGRGGALDAAAAEDAATAEAADADAPDGPGSPIGPDDDDDASGNAADATGIP